MSFPLYFDENLRHSVAGQLRSGGDDIVTAADAGLAGRRVADGTQVAYAANQGRVLITHDLKTLPDAAQRWVASGQSHPAPGRVSDAGCLPHTTP